MRGSAAFGEERLEDGGTVGGEDARGDFHLMVEARMGEDFETGADGAAFGIVGAVDEARDTGLDDGAGAHAAGLDGDVERGVDETVVAEKTRGFAQCDNFGVGGGVAIADGAVARTRQDLAFMDEHSADGDFAGCGGGTGFGERFLHELDISFHLRRENNTRGTRSGIDTGITENAENTEKKDESSCLTIGEGGNTLGPCGNSWSVCFKWIS
jgi:hypothetical protein